MQFLLPIILVVISAGAFFTFIDPRYQEVKGLQKEKAEYVRISENTERVRDIRNSLKAKYNAISVEQLDRLEKLLPPHIDNIRLILDINNIAQRNGNMTIRDIQIDEGAGQGTGAGGSIASTGSDLYGTVIFSFSVTTTYGNFKNFMEDVSRSLRIIDVTSLDITKLNDVEGDFYRFGVGIQTYWLK